MSVLQSVIQSVAPFRSLLEAMRQQLPSNHGHAGVFNMLSVRLRMRI